jgi:hypothetical protein
MMSNFGFLKIKGTDSKLEKKITIIQRKFISENVYVDVIKH